MTVTIMPLQPRERTRIMDRQTERCCIASEPDRQRWRVAWRTASVALGLFAAADAHPPTTAARLSAIRGLPNSGVQVQNLDLSQAADITLDFFPVDIAKPPVTIARANVAPGAVVNVYVPSEPQLPKEPMAVTISSTRHHGALARLDWPQTMAAVMYDEVIASDEVVVPLAAIEHEGRTTRIAFQNADAGSAQAVLLELVSSAGGPPAATKSVQLAPGRATTVDLGRDAAFADVQRPFLGWVRLSPTLPIAAHAIVDVTTSPVAAFGFEGISEAKQSAQLFVPLFRNDFFGTTAIAVVNPGPNPVLATLTYHGSAQAFDPACRSALFTHAGGPVTVAAEGSVVFDQRNFPAPNTGPSGLPTQCFGSAVLQTTGGSVVATVVDVDPALQTAAAYNAVPVEDTSRITGVPLVRNQHTQLNLSTGVQAMNTGPGTANATIRIFTDKGEPVACPRDCTRDIPSLASFTWYPPTMADLNGPGKANAFFGSAVITSPQPLAVIVNDSSPSGTQDAATFNGLPRHEDPPVDAAAEAAHSRRGGPSAAGGAPSGTERVRSHQTGHIGSI